MKKNCSEFFVEPANIWATAIVVLDANVLLGLHRLDEQSRKLFLGALHARRDRLWLPHQFAAEYLFSSGALLKSDLMAARARIRQGSTSIVNDLKNFSRNKVLDVKGLCEAVQKELSKIEEKISIDEKIDAAIRSEVVDLFQDRVGEPFNTDRLLRIYTDGEIRYAAGLPPGYRDKGKPANKFGDLLGWLQIVEFASAKKTPILIVTADGKDDWWFEYPDKRRVPRPELVREMKQCSGQGMWLATDDEFFSRASKEDGRSKRAISHALTQMAEAEAARRAIEATLVRDNLKMMGMAKVAAQMQESLRPFTAPTFQPPSYLDTLSTAFGYNQFAAEGFARHIAQMQKQLAGMQVKNAEKDVEGK